MPEVTMAAIAGFMSRYWFWICLVAVLVYLPLFLFLPKSSKVEWFSRLATVTVVVIVVPQILAWVLSWGSSSSTSSAYTCPPAVRGSVGRCVLTEQDREVLIGELFQKGTLQLCLVWPDNKQIVWVQTGDYSFKIRSASGSFPVEYKLWPPGKCPDKF